VKAKMWYGPGAKGKLDSIDIEFSSSRSAIAIEKRAFSCIIGYDNEGNIVNIEVVP